MGIDDADTAGGVCADHKISRLFPVIPKQECSLRLRSSFTNDKTTVLVPAVHVNQCKHLMFQVNSIAQHKQSADYLLGIFPSLCPLVPFCDFPIFSNKHKIGDRRFLRILPTFEHRPCRLIQHETLFKRKFET